MGLDAAAQIGEAIGGAAGVIALIWNIRDAARHRKAGRAPELRALLSQTVAVLDEVIKEARVDDWFREKVDPVYMELDRLQPVLSGRIKSDLGLLVARLAHLRAMGLYPTLPAPEAARYSVSQRELAKQALDLTNSVRRRWAGE